MRATGVVAIAIVIASCLASANGRAQEFQGTISASFGYTDNVTGAPRTPPAGVPGAEADLFAILSPGAAMLIETPRASYRLSYVFTTNLFFSHSEGDTFGNVVALASRFETTPTTNLFLGVTGEEGQQNQVVIGQPANATAIQAVRPNTNLYFRAGASEGLEKQFSEALTGNQSLTAGAFFPVDGQRAYTLDNTLGLTHHWQFDTGALTLGVTYTRYEPFNDTPRTQQLLNHAGVSWIHSWTEHLSSQLDAGILLAMRANDGGGRVFNPLGGAGLHYIRDEFSADVEYAHAGAPNVFVGGNVLTDSVTLRAGVPIAQTNLALAASGGYQTSRVIGANGDLGNPVPVWQGDAALLWNPDSGTGNFQFSLRYQITDQLGDPDPKPGFEATADYIRNTIIFSIVGAYPDVTQATAPAALSPPYRPTPVQGGDIERQQENHPRGPASPESPTSPTSPRSP